MPPPPKRHLGDIFDADGVRWLVVGFRGAAAILEPIKVLVDESRRVVASGTKEQS